MELDGKVVTGAGSGIGKATAMRLARAGAQIGLLDELEPELTATAAAIEAAGGRAVVLLADVADAARMERALQLLVDACGRLDIMVANAGINGVWAPIDELAPEEWDRTININLRGTFLTLHYAVPHLKAAGRGAVVITSSINGTRTFSNTGATAYACSKAAQFAMAKMLALELAKHHIRVNVICPGSIDTAINYSTQAHITGPPVWIDRGQSLLIG